MADCNYCSYMQKIDILCGELVQFINPFIFLTLLLLGLSNVHDNEFEKKCSCYCRVEKLLL